MKTCTKCLKRKELSEFNKLKKAKDGLSYTCKICQRKLQDSYKAKEKRKLSKNRKLREKEYYRNKEQKEKSALLRLENLKLKLNDNKKCTGCEQIKHFRDFTKRNGGKIGSICKQCHSDQQNSYIKGRKKTDREFKLKCNLRNRITNLMAKYVKMGIKEPKSGSAVKDLGCTIEQFCQYIESLWQPGMSWDNYGNKEGQWSLDHIFPLSRIDLTNREQFLKANHYTNLQPMWHIENIVKSDKLLSNLTY